jgi:hypothetical protein
LAIGPTLTRGYGELVSPVTTSAAQLAAFHHHVPDAGSIVMTDPSDGL